MLTCFSFSVLLKISWRWTSTSIITEFIWWIEI